MRIKALAVLVTSLALGTVGFAGCGYRRWQGSRGYGPRDRKGNKENRSWNRESREGNCESR